MFKYLYPLHSQEVLMYLEDVCQSLDRRDCCLIAGAKQRGGNTVPCVAPFHATHFQFVEVHYYIFGA